MHLVHIGRAPSYLAGSVTATRDLDSRSRLRSADSRPYEPPRTLRVIAERGFSLASNSVSATLHELSNL